MSKPTVAIVGAGIAGISAAYFLTKAGYRVHLFEKGPDARPNAEIFEAYTNLVQPDIPALPPSLQHVEQSGEAFSPNLTRELKMRVGGQATEWEAITLRMHPRDFALNTLYGRGMDWPLTYKDIEPYYSRAEYFLGVAGTDADNPFAPERSAGYPLPPFEMSYYEAQLAENLRDMVHIHTTPQARTRHPYDGRPACINIGACNMCPIGARYMPQHHLNQALATGLLTLETETSVRRILTDANGTARGVLIQRAGESTPAEHPADIVLVAAGAIPSTRLLLLSTTSQYPDGIGNHSGHLGQHVFFHATRVTRIRLRQEIYRNRSGFWTMQSLQRADHSERDRFGGIKLEFIPRDGYSSPIVNKLLPEGHSDDVESFLDAVQNSSATQDILLSKHVEMDATPQKYITLADATDAYGDPFAHVHHELSDFDYETFTRQHRWTVDIAQHLDAEITHDVSAQTWGSGHHHMGGCRMSENPADGVLNPYGEVHHCKNLYVSGSATFPGTMAVNPTLTLLAITLRTLDYIVDQ